MKGLTEMMRQAQELQGRMAEMQAALEALEVVGRAGGDMVSVTLSGKGDMKAIHIDPSLLKPGEAALVEDLVLAAMADARRALEARTAQEMGKLTGGLSLPPGFKLPF